MAVKVRGKSDKIIDDIVQALKAYQTANKKAKIDVYRQNPVSVRIRIVDPAFQSLDKPTRHSQVWRYLEQLPEDVQGDISMLLLLAPQEVKTSFANLEFEDPITSSL